MSDFMDITGQRYGRLTVITCANRDKNGPRWLCHCDCGNSTVASLRNLRGGRTRSCGCLQSEMRRKMHLRHGEAHKTAEYRAWKKMRERCQNPNCHVFKHYGGRGISVCERWHRYENFLADMGRRPLGTSLDRINNDGNYEPSNCQWATAKQQANNRRRSNR